MIKHLLLKLAPKRKRTIGKVGNVEIEEFVFELKEASIVDANISQIRHKALLDSKKPSDYISVREAHYKTSLSESWIRTLARKGKIEGLFIKNRWLILKESLESYIKLRKRS